MTRMRSLCTLVPAVASLTLGAAQPVRAADQTVPGAGNAEAIALASASPLVTSARRTLRGHAERIRNAALRTNTLDAIDNPRTCVQHRAGLSDADKDAIVQDLVAQRLINLADAASIVGGAKAGVFPPVLRDGTGCPQLPQRFFSAPGSVYGGHHSYPGGLPVHETANMLSDQSLAGWYRRVYGHGGHDGLPEIVGELEGHLSRADIEIDEDIIIAAPI